MIAEPDSGCTDLAAASTPSDGGAKRHGAKRSEETLPFSWHAATGSSGGLCTPLRGLRRWAVYALAVTALSLATGLAGAQQEPPSPPNTLPPLPPPTAAQLERGRELLDKIAYVAAKVPLTDAAAVLAVFGFTDLHTREYPTYTGVQPKGQDGGGSQPKDLVGTGLADIEVRPRIRWPTGRTGALFDGRLSLCYVPPYSGFFVPSYFGVRQAESPTLSPGGLAPATGWDKGPIGIGER
ncbi:hypothetical protein CAP2UW1_1915 [Candidatus Accumulibacter phosphatis]|uniref:Uncharacterized protein n=1 Tax=Accumulibacter regalis TaxID=522306 RepID=C7RLW3_ACCRE